MWLEDCLTGTNPNLLSTFRTSLQDRLGSFCGPDN